MMSSLIHQRIRNRIIEILEWILESEYKVPELGFNELINSWADWADILVNNPNFPLTYTASEINSLMNVNLAIEAFCESTPPMVPDIPDILALPEWSQLVSSARLAHAELMKRGRFSEDVVSRYE